MSLSVYFCFTKGRSFHLLLLLCTSTLHQEEEEEEEGGAHLSHPPHSVAVAHPRGGSRAQRLTTLRRRLGLRTWFTVKNVVLSFSILPLNNKKIFLHLKTSFTGTMSTIPEADKEK